MRFSVTDVTQIREVAKINQKHLDSIMSCALFQGMTQDESALLLDCLNPKIRSFGRNVIANMADDPFDGIGIVLSGQVAIVKENNAGDRMILSILKPGDLFGEMAAFSGSGSWPATVIAQSACSIMYLPPDKITGQCTHSCQGHRTLIMNMLSILSKKALALSRKLEYLSIRSIRSKIAVFLLEQVKKNGHTTFMISMNRSEMADFLNVSRPSLSREMCRMRDEGILDFHRSSMQIRDIKALKASAE